MKKGKILFLVAMGLVASLILAGCATPAVQSNQNIPTNKVEVNRYGFNNSPGDFYLDVEEGQEVEITFVYGDNASAQNNPHNIASLEYGITTGILDRNNPEVTLSFVAKETGQVVFSCIATECIGHHNLHSEDAHDDDDDDDDHDDLATR